MKIGNKIKQRRIELGMSVEDVALKLGKNKATVYRYENGDIKNLPTSILLPLAEALDTTPAFLMEWDQNTEYIISNEDFSICVETTHTDKYSILQMERYLHYYAILSDVNKNKVLSYLQKLLDLQNMEDELK